MKVFLDLFSGTHSACKGFLMRGWRVITVELNEGQDVMTYQGPGCHVDVLWASPPCTEFSRLDLPGSWKCNQGKSKIPDMTLFERTLELINLVNPDVWIIENTRGARRWFAPYIGDYTQKCGSRYLWGNFPKFDFDQSQCYGKWKLSPGINRSKIRSKIPFTISDNLARVLS